jgi:MFS family permease
MNDPPSGSGCGDAPSYAERWREFAASDDCRSLGLLLLIFANLGFNGEVIRLVMFDTTDVSDTAKAWIGSSMQVGALVGATLGGRFGDLYGRRTAILAACAGFMLVAGLALMLEMTYWRILGLHVCRGLNFGLCVANAQPWATERLSDERRGWVSAYGHMGWTVGHSLALGFAKLGITRTRDLEVLPLVPAISVFFVVLACNESAAWQNESRDILPYTELLRGHGHKMAMLAVMWLVIPASSYIAFFWGPVLLNDLSGDAGVDYVYFMIVHLSSIPSAFLAGCVVDYGRRLTLFIDLLCLTGGFIAIQLAPTTAIWKVTFLFIEVCITFGWTIGPILTSESFPTVFRARAYGTLQLFVRISSISGPVVTGSLRDNDKIHYLFNGLASLAFAAACSIFFMPEPQFRTKREAAAEDASLTSA